MFKQFDNILKGTVDNVSADRVYVIFYILWLHKMTMSIR